MFLDSASEKLIALLQDSGYKAYAVGGCVRDCILGREIGDIDITTSAKPDETEAVLIKSGIKYVETGIKHGTITAIVEGIPYEITTFRCDGDYNDNRHPSEVAFVSNLSEDLARRDFTVNTLAYNSTEGIVDLYGGIEDINNRIIKAVGDPDRRFNEDALRIMRAIRFASVLGFKIEEETKKSIFRNKELLKNIANERIYTELVKLLLGDNCEEVLLEYKEVIAVIIPELKKCFGFEQNCKWHSYDVYTHIVKSVAASEKTDYIRLALLLHDIGKPLCLSTDENGNDHFYNHADMSVTISEKVLSRLRVSNEIKYKVLTLICFHDKPLSLKPSKIKKYLRELGEDLFFDLIKVKSADNMARNPEFIEEGRLHLVAVSNTAKEILNSGEPYRISDLKIDGNDLLDIGFRGKAIRAELEKLINEVSGNPNCNERKKLLRQAQTDYTLIRR